MIFRFLIRSLEFPSPREPSGVGDGRAANGSPVEGKRVSTVPRERSRSPQSSRGKPLKQVQCSQSADNEKQESTLAAREVGPAANTEKSVAFAEREVGPAGDKKVTGSSAREAASSAVAIGLAKQVAGPIASSWRCVSRQQRCYSAEFVCCKPNQASMESFPYLMECPQ